MRIILNQMNFENRLNDQELDEYKKFMSIYKEDEKLQYSMEHKVDNIIGVITAIGVMIVFALLLMLCNIFIFDKIAGTFTYLLVTILVFMLAIMFVVKTIDLFSLHAKICELFYKNAGFIPRSLQDGKEYSHYKKIVELEEYLRQCKNEDLYISLKENYEVDTDYFSPKMKISVTYATREDGDVLDKNIIVTFNGVKRNCKAKIPSFDLCTGFVTLPVDETGKVKR